MAGADQNQKNKVILKESIAVGSGEGMQGNDLPAATPTGAGLEVQLKEKIRVNLPGEGIQPTETAQGNPTGAVSTGTAEPAANDTPGYNNSLPSATGEPTGLGDNPYQTTAPQAGGGQGNSGAQAGQQGQVGGTPPGNPGAKNSKTQGNEIDNKKAGELNKQTAVPPGKATQESGQKTPKGLEDKNRQRRNRVSGGGGKETPSLPEGAKGKKKGGSGCFTKGCCVGLIVVILFLSIFGMAVAGSLLGVGSSLGGMLRFGLSGMSGAAGECWNLTDSNAITAEQAKEFLRKKGAPIAFQESADSLITAAKRMGINPALMIAINGQESSFGKEGRAVPNKNPGNTKISTSTARAAGVTVIGHDDGGHAIFPNWEEGWAGVAVTLKDMIYNRKLTTIYAMNAGPDGKIDGQGGYAESTTWYIGVRKFMGEMLPCTGGAAWGPEISGRLYPPLADNQGCAYHKDHTTMPFESKLGFQRVVPHGAVDWSGKGCAGGGIPVYATFSGEIKDVRNDHISVSGGNKHSANIVWLADGSNEAVYAHIIQDPGIVPGVRVEKGKRIGHIAAKGEQEMALTPHLHFQLWLNGNALIDDQLVQLYNGGR